MNSPDLPKKKNHKILVQMALFIIILFAVLVLTVGNMFTVSSFSTSLINMRFTGREACKNISDILLFDDRTIWMLQYIQDPSLGL